MKQWIRVVYMTSCSPTSHHQSVILLLPPHSRLGVLFCSYTNLHLNSLFCNTYLTKTWISRKVTCDTLKMIQSWLQPWSTNVDLSTLFNIIPISLNHNVCYFCVKSGVNFSSTSIRSIRRIVQGCWFKVGKTCAV